MINHTIFKYFIVVIILIILAAGFVFFVSLNTNTKPYQILTSAIYESGTVVSLYEEIPVGFPDDVILEKRPLDYSGVVAKPDGKIQVGVSYVSDKEMLDVVSVYDKLPENGWKIEEKTVYDKVSSIIATKNDQNILITIASLEEGGTKVTFQYEK